MPTANASMCAGEQGKFWEMHDAIFENNRALEDTNLQSYATKIGLDGAKFKACYSANKFKDQIIGDQQTANKLGARGTPAFFINGRYISGAQPFPAFDALVREELKKAKSSGVSAAEYYDKVIVGRGSKSM